MTSLVFHIVVILAVCPCLIDAHATTYEPGLMEIASKNHGLPPADCMVSSPFHDPGIWLRVDSRNTGRILICRTSDVSAEADIDRHQRARLFEFDVLSWQILCGTIRIGEQSWRDCHIDVYEIEIRPWRKMSYVTAR